jgi:hypothetical protein
MELSSADIKFLTVFVEFASDLSLVQHQLSQFCSIVCFAES